MRRIFTAPRSRVFAAWADPSILQRWFRPTPDGLTPVVEADVRTGGSYTISVDPGDGPAVTFTGVFREVAAPDKLVFTWVRDATEPETLVTVEFRDHPNGTEITLTHTNLASPASRDRHQWGWNGSLDNLARLLERE
jgi:uncharacterized protein YndB with AHSA1/START domain